MNCSAASSSCTNAHSNLSKKTHKRCRHRRRKNKCKNSCSNSRKKNSRKFAAMNSIHSRNNFKSKKSQFTNSFGFHMKNMTSNWYWSNYRKAFDWQGKHETAQWKAYALALEEENEYLKQVIRNCSPDMHHENVNLFNAEVKVEDGDSNQAENNSESDMEFEMSEEMIKFFQQSFKHKMDMKKQKEEKELKVETDKIVMELQTNRLKRCKEMEFLYGEEASKITGMETAIQLSFDRYCDSKSPKYWPNIPLKL